MSDDTSRGVVCGGKVVGDLANFAMPLRDVMCELGEEYHCVITAYVGSGDSFVVNVFSFVNGAVQ